MSGEPQTWHYGVVARYWAEFNDDFRSHEIPYFRRFVERDGEPALDVACGTGRLLIPYLRAGLDVDGCDISADMIELCREKAEREGLSPTVWVQPMHDLEPPRLYRTIYVCGAFGLGSSRAEDVEALQRFHAALEPGGTLLLDLEVPYADTHQWPYWVKKKRGELPEPARSAGERRRAADGTEYALSARVVELHPLEQRVSLEMHAEQWRDGELEEDETRLLTIQLYFPHELRLLLERAGFTDVELQGDHNGAPATGDDDFVVFVAKK